MQVTYRPESDGYSSGSYSRTGDTANWSCLDDVSADNFTSYLSANTGQTCRAYCHFANPAERGKINSVTIYVRGYVSGDGAYMPSVYNDSTPSDGAWISTSGWTTTAYTLTTNPWTSGDWSWDDLNNLQIGGLFFRYSTDSRGILTQVYVVIDYTPSIIPIMNQYKHRWS